MDCYLKRTQGGALGEVIPLTDVRQGICRGSHTNIQSRIATKEK